MRTSADSTVRFKESEKWWNFHSDTQSSSNGWASSPLKESFYTDRQAAAKHWWRRPLPASQTPTSTSSPDRKLSPSSTASQKPACGRFFRKLKKRLPASYSSTRWTPSLPRGKKCTATLPSRDQPGRGKNPQCDA